ncbi:MAG: hypothetical protein U5K75_00075 [Ahrensia sp.]|nr:hypothetical protein [Ahrensia sp.]
MVSDFGIISCPLPHRAMSQLIQYKEWADARFVGDENTPYSKAARQNAKTVRSVNYFAVPDEMFVFGNDGTNDYFETFMYSNEAIASETPMKNTPPSMTQHDDREGSPWLIKSMLSGCAVGIQRVGVKKLRFKANVLPERVAVLTEAA